MVSRKRAFEKILFCILDLFCILVSLLLAFFCRFKTFNILNLSFFSDYITMVILCYVSYFLTAFVSKYYNNVYSRNIFEEFHSVFSHQFLMWETLIVSLFIFHISTSISRLFLTLSILFSTVLVFLTHIIVKRTISVNFRDLRYSNKTLLISGNNTEEIIQTLRKPNNTTHKIVGIVFLNSWIEKQTGTIPSTIKHIPVVCTQDQIINYVSHKEIDDVIVAVDIWNDINSLRNILLILQRMGINVNLNISPVVKLFNTKNSFSSIGDYNTILLTRNIFSNRQLFAKRVLDFIGSLIGLVFLAISFIFVAPIIKLTSKGPVFFVQKRVGKNGRIFNFYKYRTMYADAEEQKKDLLSQNEVNGLMFKMSNDPRITKIGKFLRKTSIDELPQFINVLKGDMSLVGTRPPTIDEYEKYSEKYKCRLSMIPGITGMWQISGRSNVLDFDEVVKLDMQYIDNWNVFKDIKILFLTVINVIFSVGAK